MDPINIKNEIIDNETEKRKNFIFSDVVKGEYFEDQTTEFENYKIELIENKKSFKSDICQSELFGHNQNTVLINERSFICDTCGKAFKTNQSVKIHKMIHTNESI